MTEKGNKAVVKFFNNMTELLDTSVWDEIVDTCLLVQHCAFQAVGMCNTVSLLQERQHDSIPQIWLKKGETLRHSCCSWQHMMWFSSPLPGNKLLANTQCQTSIPVFMVRTAPVPPSVASGSGAVCAFHPRGGDPVQGLYCSVSQFCLKSSPLPHTHTKNKCQFTDTSRQTANGPVSNSSKKKRLQTVTRHSFEPLEIIEF